MEIREKLREALERDISSEEFKEFFQDLQNELPILANFPEPSEFLKFMYLKNEDMYETKDMILRVLISKYQKENSSFLTSLLCLIFLPVVDSIYNSKKYQGFDNEDLWGEIQVAFLTTLKEYPISKRPYKVASNIKFDTLNKLCKWLKKEREWRNITTFNVNIKPRKETNTFNEPCITSSVPTGAQEKREAIDFLLQLAEKGVISEQDYHLILSTRIYGEKIKDYAKKNDLTYEAAYKRRQRVDKLIKKHLRHP